MWLAAVIALFAADGAGPMLPSGRRFVPVTISVAGGGVTMGSVPGLLGVPVALLAP